MREHLDGFPESIEEDALLLEGDLEWPTRCVILYRTCEKKAATWLLDASKLLEEVLRMNFVDAKAALEPLPALLEQEDDYVKAILALIKASE
jgi:hypothetical protein